MCRVLIKTTLSVNFLHEQTRVRFSKRGRTQKRNARSVRRKKQNKSPWRRGTTSVSHSEGSVHDWCVFSKDRTRPTSSVNAIKFKLAGSALSHRCLQSLAVCSGCVVHSKRVEVRNRGSQTRFANASTCSIKSLPRQFFHDARLVRSTSWAVRNSKQFFRQPARTRKDDTNTCFNTVFF